jgi:hypothetical protein
MSRFEIGCTGSTYGIGSSSARGSGKELAWVIKDNIEKYFKMIGWENVN